MCQDLRHKTESQRSISSLSAWPMVEWHTQCFSKGAYLLPRDAADAVGPIIQDTCWCLPINSYTTPTVSPRIMHNVRVEQGPNSR